MIAVKEHWLTKEAPQELVEKIVDTLYQVLKGSDNPYMVVHIGDLLAHLGILDGSNNNEQEDEAWVSAIYTAERKGRIALLAGNPQHFQGNLHLTDHGLEGEEQSMLHSALREPDGKVQIFAILRDW